jgi:hypothetical protein
MTNLLLPLLWKPKLMKGIFQLFYSEVAQLLLQRGVLLLLLSQNHNRIDHCSSVTNFASQVPVSSLRLTHLQIKAVQSAKKAASFTVARTPRSYITSFGTDKFNPMAMGGMEFRSSMRGRVA